MQLKKTPLHDFHVQHKAKMVPFAGYSMPLSYGETGQSESCPRPARPSTRSHAVPSHRPQARPIRRRLI